MRRPRVIDSTSHTSSTLAWPHTTHDVLGGSGSIGSSSRELLLCCLTKVYL